MEEMIELKRSRDLQRYDALIKSKIPIPGDVFIKGEPIFNVFRFNPKWKELWIAPLSDCHYGNPLFSEHHFIRTIRTINSKPFIFTILNGDLIECTTKTSVGDIYEQIGDPQEQRDWMIERLRPIKHKILGMTMGNHEMRIKQSGIDICRDIATALDIPYRPEGITTRVMFGSGNDGHPDRPYIYDIYATHGYGGARTKGGKSVKVERSGHFVHADVYLMSHDHEVNVAEDNYLMPTSSASDIGKRWQTGKFFAHRKLLVKTNSYLKWGGYAEMKGFSPNGLFTPIIKLSGEGKPRIRVEI